MIILRHHQAASVSDALNFAPRSKSRHSLKDPTLHGTHFQCCPARPQSKLNLSMWLWHPFHYSYDLPTPTVDTAAEWYVHIHINWRPILHHTNKSYVTYLDLSLSTNQLYANHRIEQPQPLYSLYIIVNFEQCVQLCTVHRGTEMLQTKSCAWRT